MCLSPNICVLCGLDGESRNHLFLHCSYARRIWTHFFEGMNLNWVMPENIKGFLSSWGRVGGARGKKGKLFKDAVVQGIMWGIWKERNWRIF